MSRVGVTAAGAIIGGVIGTVAGGNTMLGVQLGAMVGGVAGALLFPDKVEGPKLGESTFSGSAYGNPIPTVAGRNMVAGEIIWMDRIRQIKQKSRGAKGGPKVTEYAYTSSVAYGICEWLTAPSTPRLLKIYLDDKLVYDSTGISEVTKVPGLTWRFYIGSDNQMPDPLIESVEGSDNAPAFRDICYIVFPDLALGQFGNRRPTARFEVASDAQSTFPQVNSIAPAVPIYASAPSGNTYISDWACNVAVDYARGRIYEGRSRSSGGTGAANDELIRVYDLATMETVGEYPMGDMVQHFFPLGVAATQASVGAGILHVGVDGYLYATGGTSNRVPLWKIDPDGWRAVGVWGEPEGAGVGFGGDDLRLINPMQIRTLQARGTGGTRTYAIVQGSYSATLVIDAEAMEYVWGANGVSTSPAVFPVDLGIGPLTFPCQLVPGEQRLAETDLWYLRAMDASTPLRVEIGKVTISPGARDLGGGVGAGIVTSDYGYVDIAASVDASATYCGMQGAFWDDFDQTLVITIAGGGGPVTGFSRFSTFKWSPVGGVVWVRGNLPMPAFHDARGEQRRVLSSKWGLGGNFVLETATGDLNVSASGDDFNNLAWLDERDAQIGYRAVGGGAHEIAKRYLLRDTANALTVGEVVEALCVRSGLDVSDIDVTSLTDEIWGFKLAHPMSAREAIQPLATGWQFDACDIDDALVFVKRGGGSVVTISYDDLVREGDAERLVLEEPREDDQSLPREVIVRHEDVARGYETNAQPSRAPLNPTPTVNSQGMMVVDVAVPMAASDAKAVAKRIRMAIWRGRTSLRFALGPKYALLTPCDVVTVGTRDGASVRARIARIEEGANFVRRIEAVAEDASVYSVTAAAETGTGFVLPTIPGPYATRLLSPDFPLLDQGDDLGGTGLREYVLAGAYDEPRWLGVHPYRSSDLATWTDLGTLASSVAWGAVTVMPAAPLSPWVFDRAGELVVRMTAGEPESATEAEVLNGANYGALIDPGDNSAEIIQWAGATDNGDGTFTLTTLLRGRRGTEDLIESRAAGCLFVVLDDPDQRIAISEIVSAIAATRYFRPVTVYDSAETAASTLAKAARGRAEKPFAPVRVETSRDGSNNISLAWVRRSRLAGEDFPDGTDEIPLGEDTEEYEVDILAGVTAAYAPVYDASSEFGPGYKAGNAFDGETATFPWVSSGLTAPQWLRVQYAKPVRIGRYSVQARDDTAVSQTPSDWTFEGWDGATWVALDARSGVTWSLAQVRTYDLATPAEYSAYRIRPTACGDSFYAIEQLRLYGAASAGANLARVDETAARTISGLTAPAATYSAANQATDFGGTVAAGGAFRRIYQISATVGRGIAAEGLL